MEKLGPYTSPTPFGLQADPGWFLIIALGESWMVTVLNSAPAFPQAAVPPAFLALVG